VAAAHGKALARATAENAALRRRQRTAAAALRAKLSAVAREKSGTRGHHERLAECLASLEEEAEEEEEKEKEKEKDEEEEEEDKDEATASPAAAGRAHGEKEPYQCDHKCGFTGSYGAVAEHESSCSRNASNGDLPSAKPGRKRKPLRSCTAQADCTCELCAAEDAVEAVGQSFTNLTKRRAAGSFRSAPT
jgi:hypothetical protein